MLSMLYEIENMLNVGQNRGLYRTNSNFNCRASASATWRRVRLCRRRWSSCRGPARSAGATPGMGSTLTSGQISTSTSTSAVTVMHSCGQIAFTKKLNANCRKNDFYFCRHFGKIFLSIKKTNLTAELNLTSRMTVAQAHGSISQWNRPLCSDYVTLSLTSRANLI